MTTVIRIVGVLDAPFRTDRSELVGSDLGRTGIERSSYVYEYNDSVLPFVSEKGPLVEIEDHDPDGASTSYHPPEGLEHLLSVPLRKK